MCSGFGSEIDQDVGKRHRRREYVVQAIIMEMSLTVMIALFFFFFIT